MLTDKQANLVTQTFYSPMRSNGNHEMIHVVHDVLRGTIFRVYTDNYITKNTIQQEILEKLPKIGNFTTTTSELNEVLKDAGQNGILNQPLPV